MAKRLELKVEGQVQGVTYRASAKRKARDLGLKGWVRNETDGSVSIVAEGRKENLKNLLEWCKSGPSPAKVEQVMKQWSPPRRQFSSFEVRY